ncbi:MAG: hypothetical protein LBP62_05645 [Clostridiales bacterium]|jgi:hypothetical protein|nr:hypothetical protein [Clostridiales bacterium]
MDKDNLTENAYIKTLETWLGDEGRAVADWLNANTTNEEFIEQPINIHQPERYLIDHALGMLDKITKLSKVFFSVSEDGKWVYKSPYTNADYARVALYHILGSIAKFRRGKRNKKDATGKWQEVVMWEYNDDKVAYGTDGETAIFVLRDIWAEYGLEPLSRDVEVAILNIEILWDNPLRSGAAIKLYGQNSLALLAHTANFLDTVGLAVQEETEVASAAS